MIAIKSIKTNPLNPRIIKDKNFDKLVRSLREFPKMTELRPIVIDENGYALGGNMRLKALIELGFDEIPDAWVKSVNDFTEEEKREFIVKDNVSFGDWDYDDLAIHWNEEPLKDWGLDLPKWDVKEVEEKEEKQIDDTAQWFINIRCKDEAHAQELYEQFIEDGLDVKIVT